MINFRSLDPETRTVALVGRFLQLWSAMEVAIGAAIGAALNSSNLEQFILHKNISFTNKLNILGALCYVSRLTLDERDKAKILLNEVFDFYPKRNNVAHDQFYESKRTDGVEFIVIKAKRKVTVPDVDWSIEDFERFFAKIDSFCMKINELSKKLRRSLPSNALVGLAGLLPYGPTEAYIGSGPQGPLTLRSLAPQQSDKNPATPETDPEIPPSPEK